MWRYALYAPALRVLSKDPPRLCGVILFARFVIRGFARFIQDFPRVRVL
jgi:hypothetical protein